MNAGDGRSTPPKTNDQHVGINGRLALFITGAVGTMWCAYAFALLAVISLPDAIKAGRPAIISWVAQTFLQLVLLSVIIVGQNIQAAAADARSQHVSDEVDVILSTIAAGHDAIHEHIDRAAK